MMFEVIGEICKGRGEDFRGYRWRDVGFEKGTRVGCNVELPLDLHHRVKKHFAVLMWRFISACEARVGYWVDELILVILASYLYVS